MDCKPWLFWIFIVIALVICRFQHARVWNFTHNGRQLLSPNNYTTLHHLWWIIFVHDGNCFKQISTTILRSNGLTTFNQMVIYLRFFIFTLRETFKCATKSVITYWYSLCVKLGISRLNSIQFIINWLNYTLDFSVMSYGPLNREKQTNTEYEKW